MGNNLGKTKQATRMKKPLYLPFEQGVNFIAGLRTVPIEKWSDFVKINKQLCDSSSVQKAREMYSTIIFDSIEPAARYCQEYICQKYGADSIASGRSGYGLWQEYATEFWKQINKLTKAGYCLYFIAHAQIDPDTGYISPKSDKRSLAPIIDATDITVYVESNGVDENGRIIKSSGYLAETDRFFARSRLDYLPTTKIEEFTAENLEAVITEAIKKQEEVEGITAVSFDEQKATREVARKSYEELMDEMQELGLKMADNGFMEDLQAIVADNLGADKKASELKKGQEQQIETIIYDIQEFLAEHGIK